MQTSELIRRILAGAAIATMVALPIADIAHAQTDTDTDGGGGGGTDTDTDGGGGATTSTTRAVINTTATTARGVGGGGSLANTGEDWTLPAALAGGGMAIALGARRVARSRGVG